MSNLKKGEKNPFFGKMHTEASRSLMSAAHSGENHPNFGKTLSEEHRANISSKLSGENHPFFGKTLSEEHRANIAAAKKGEKNPFFGKTHTEEALAKMSITQKGPKNHNSKPVCVFGKLYDAASIASDTLCDVCDTRSKGNFIKEWTYTSKHHHNVFYVSKEFYNAMFGTSEIITRYMYEQWSS
jgi:hypothetical protein